MNGWLCTDIDDCDISKPLPYPNESFEFAYASHVAEHITTHQCLFFFREVHRILKPHGVFRIVVPTLEKVKDRAHAADLILGHGHLQVFSKESLRDMLWTAGFDRDRVIGVEKDDILDVHCETIGVEKDETESARLEATK
jgi:predicted SAM-dependent methyltransferase